MTINLTPTISVDSLKVRIPLSKVDECNSRLISNQTIEVSELTGEVIKVKNKGYRIPISPSAIIHVDIGKIKTSQTEVTDCLIILLTSKILEERYFEGITKDNLQLVYDKLVTSGLFSFTWQTFIESECTDIDLKFDEYMNQATRMSLVKSFNSMVIPKRTDSVKPYFKPTKKNNYSIGIQFNKRDRATNSKPFFKLYSKGPEAKHKDIQAFNRYGDEPFFETYFGYQALEDIMRIETTIKDKDMFKLIAKRMNVTNATNLRLGNIMEWSEDFKIAVFGYMFSKYLDEKTLNPLEKPTEDKVSADDIRRMNALAMLINVTDSPLEMLIEGLVKNQPKTVKYRERVKYQEVYRKYIENTSNDLSEDIKKVSDYLYKFGLYKKVHIDSTTK